MRKNRTLAVAVNELKNYAPKLTGSKSKETSSEGSVLANVGSELQVRNDDGRVEKFIMTLQPWVQHPAQESSRQAVRRMLSSANSSSGGDTYLALDPDFFYIREVSGEEQYPVTFPAVSMSNANKKIMVTITRQPNGERVYHFSAPQTETGAVRNAVNSANGNQPNLIFAEATPVQNVVPGPGPGPCPEGIAGATTLRCGGGGGGGGTGGGGSGGGGSSAPCTSVSGYGGPVSSGGSSSGDTFFDLYKLHLWANGEGGANTAEMQMIVDQNDNYGKCLPQKPKYNFNWRTTASYTDGQGTFYSVPSTVNYGADGVLYRTQDVTTEGTTYSFLHTPSVQLVYPTQGNGYQFYYANTGQSTGGFPLFNLTDEPGPWRLVLNENDKSYQDFSVHTGNNHLNNGVYVDDIHTFDMSSGTWSMVSTGFTPYQFSHGNSDDPIRESGTRRITVANVQNQSANVLGIGSAVSAQKSYPSRGQYFKYVYGLKAR